MFPEIYKNATLKVLPVETSGDFLKNNLKQGDILSGRIVKSLKDGKYLIEIKNSNVLAESELPLSEGEKVYLKVVKVSSKLELQIIRGENILQNPEEKILFLKKIGIEPSRLFINILEVLKENKLPLNQKDITYIGGLLEKFITDDKKRLNKDTIRAVILLYKKGVTIEEELINEIEMLLENNTTPEKIIKIFKKIIDKTGDINEKENYPAYLNFPFSADFKKEWIELFLFKENIKRHPGESSTITIHIFFETQALGRFKIVINSIGKRLDIVFYIEDEEVLQFFQTEKKILAEKLASIDLKVERLLFRTGENLRTDKINTFFNIVEKNIKNVDLKV